MQDLDIAQKRALIARRIQTLRHEARNKAQSLLGAQGPNIAWSLFIVCPADTLEIMLLLLWRHLQYYTDVKPVGSQVQASTPHITRLVASMDLESFKAEVLRKLGSLLQRLDTLDVVITVCLL